jgi:hypothetical protein
MQRHKSPWREMASAREADRRIDHALLVIALPLTLWAAGFLLGGLALVLGEFPSAELRTGRMLSLATSTLILVLYGLAAWRISRRQAVGGYLGLLLFLYQIVIAAVNGRVFSFGVGYACLGIFLILRAAEPLGMRLPALQSEYSRK